MTPCVACGSPGSDRQPVTDDFGYRRCRRCGLGVIDPWPGAGEAEAYDVGYFQAGGARAGYADYEADARWHRSTARHRLDRVERAAPPRADGRRRLLDVGAAVGYVLDEAVARGWLADGLDRSSWAVARGRDRGHRMSATWNDVDDGPRQAVTFFQVLEHMDDPADALRRAAGLLAPGGVVVCETWDAASRTARLAGARWQQLSPPSVQWLFTPDSAGRLVEAAGLERVSWRRTPKTVGAGTVVGQLLGTSTSAPARRTARVLAPVGLPYVFDDLVTFVARRPSGPRAR